jgi:hypothetical protein
MLISRLSTTERSGGATMARSPAGQMLTAASINNSDSVDDNNDFMAIWSAGTVVQPGW